MRTRVRRSAAFLLTALALMAPAARTAAQPAAGVWPQEKAAAWQRQAGWLVGSNYAPSTAINQLEMWQAETWDPQTIDRELGWAHSLGFNSMRVFLHHLLWQQDSAGFLRRMEQFLDIAEKHDIRVMFVLFDAVWDPFPRLGPQRAPEPHLHNSGWVQSPGAELLRDTSRYAELEPYVKGVVGHFRNDPRVVVWDLFNEPDNLNRPAYFALEPDNKPELALLLLRKTFAWARAVNPTQPLTAAPWKGDYVEEARMLPITRFMLENSDVVSFHSYDPLPAVQRQVQALQRYGRPILNTEYMARPRGSTFGRILPHFQEQGVGAYNWGFVAGDSQTIYPWDSWTREYHAEPDLWFHDIFYADGKAYDPAEVLLIRSLTGRK